METSYIISDIFFDLGRFELILNHCPILRETIHRVHDSLLRSYFSDYSAVVGFVHDTLKKNDCPFRFSLHSIYPYTTFTSSAGNEYILIKVLIRVS